MPPNVDFAADEYFTSWLKAYLTAPMCLRTTPLSSQKRVLIDQGIGWVREHRVGNAWGARERGLRGVAEAWPGCVWRSGSRGCECAGEKGAEVVWTQCEIGCPPHGERPIR